MALWRQARSDYLTQCWSRSLSPYGVTRPQWVNALRSLYTNFYYKNCYVCFVFLRVQTRRNHWLCLFRWQDIIWANSFFELTTKKRQISALVALCDVNQECTGDFHAEIRRTCFSAVFKSIKAIQCTKKGFEVTRRQRRHCFFAVKTVK